MVYVYLKNHRLVELQFSVINLPSTYIAYSVFIFYDHNTLGGKESCWGGKASVNHNTKGGKVGNLVVSHLKVIRNFTLKSIIIIMT